MKKNGKAALPKYALVSASLIDKINRRELGSALPPENDLAAEYGVSRITVRRALEELERQNYIVRKQGVGTFINQPGLDKENLGGGQRSGLGRVIRNAGKEPGTVQLQKFIRPVGEAVGGQMDLSPETPILFYRRIYTADGTPAFLVDSTINHQAFLGIENYDYNFISLSTIVRQSYGGKLYWKSSDVNSVKAGWTAEFLEVEPGQPLLHFTYSSYLRQGSDMVPFEHVEMFALTDVVPIGPDFFK